MSVFYLVLGFFGFWIFVGLWCGLPVLCLIGWLFGELCGFSVVCEWVLLDMFMIYLVWDGF